MARKKNSDERTHLFCLWVVTAVGEEGWTADNYGRGRLRAQAGTRASDAALQKSNVQWMLRQHSWWWIAVATEMPQWLQDTLLPWQQPELCGGAIRHHFWRRIPPLSTLYKIQGLLFIIF